MAGRRTHMMRILTLLLVLSAGSARAQELGLPDRPADASTGSELAEEWRGLPLAEREERVFEEIMRGNVPTWLRTLRSVRVATDPAAPAATIWVTPDYLAVGSDDDYLLVPMTPQTAQRIADRLRCSLPTPRLVDAIWSVASLRLEPTPIPPSPDMTTVPVFWAHSVAVRRQRTASDAPFGALTSGHKKDVVITPRLATSPGKVAIYGWHEEDGDPIQPLYLGHTDRWVDYSHGIRLVDREIVVDGERMDLWLALADPELATLLSGEGRIVQPAYAYEPAR